MEAGIHELTAGYALAALDPDERSAYEAHLAGCEHCQQELESFWQTTEALAVAASGPDPSPALRDRILADIRAEPAQNVIPFEPRRRRVAPVFGAVAAVAAVVALGLGIWGSSLSGELDETRVALERERAAATVVANPDSRTIALEAGNGRLVVDPDGAAALVLHGLGPAPRGKTYATWIIDGAEPRPAGLFPGQDGIDVIAVEGQVVAGTVVAVTVEPTGGVEFPSAAPIVTSDPV